jgi:tetratricopeptide (TPR) repeat protein/DNA-binding CsgD family transcriptional regulator
MTIEVGIDKKKELYTSCLVTICGVKFTIREIDIIACVLHNRGEKKIASLLMISPRTVGTHLHNIMLKIGKNSREHIIDFIEKSGKLQFVKKYYLQILVQSSFEQNLTKIGKTISRRVIDCLINVNQLNVEEKHKLNSITTHLKLANINLVAGDSGSEACKYNIHFITSSWIPKAEPGDIFLLLNKPSGEDDLSHLNYIDFHQDADYYLSVFMLLKNILNDKEITQISNEFIEEYEAIKSSWEGGDAELPGEIDGKTSIIYAKTSRKSALVLLAVTFFVVINSILYFNDNSIFLQRENSQNLLHSELSLPRDGLLLERKNIITQIKDSFKNKPGIQTVALVGIGGSGKSTIAKKYARESSASLIWEVNAESLATLSSSIKQIAYAIAMKDNIRNELDQILGIKEIAEQEKGLILFLRKKTKSCPGWLIIFDNVKTFKDIEKFFPRDSAVWGDGNVIITTSDNNIAHNENIWSENIIQVGPLSNKNKLALFSSILGKESVNKYKIDYRKCLEEIPPFPLDVSIAAHYIKAMHIRCSEYSKYSSDNNTIFMNTQRNILNNVGEYSKTRYDIISLPIQHMVDESSDFRDLLLMISAINSQNIPKSLLTAYKDDIIVDNFIYELKKFSLITKDHAEGGGGEQLFSIPRGAQGVIFAYFMNSSQIVDNTEQRHNISMFIESYLSKILNKHDVLKIQAFVPHVESLLKQSHLFDNRDMASLNKKLGISHFYLGKYNSAQEALKTSLRLYKQSDKKTGISQSMVLARLGSVYRNISEYQKAKESLEKAFESFKIYYGTKHVKTAWISTTLGSVYRNTGEFAKAKKFLEEGYNIYREHYGEEHIDTIWSSAYLAQLHKNQGNYSLARRLLEKVLTTFEKEYGENHAKTAWCLMHLANVYRSIGYLDKAKEYCLRAMEIYRQNRGEKSFEYSWSATHLGHIYRNLGDLEKSTCLLRNSMNFYSKNLSPDHANLGWVKFHLGSVYRRQGKIEQAWQLLKESLQIIENYYGKNHMQSAQILLDLGKFSLDNQSFEVSKEYLDRCIAIYASLKHTDVYKGFEALGNLYDQVYKKERSNDSKLKMKENWSKALSIAKRSLPDDSSHIQRIQAKLKSIESN